MRRITVFIVLVFGSLVNAKLFAQDVHFSQFYAAPLNLNPAFSGDFEGAWRVTAIGRQQGDANFDNDGKPFQTAAIGFDLPFHLEDMKFGAGLYAVQDVNGIGQFNTTKIMASLAGEFKVPGGNTIRIGLQPSYNMFNSNAGDLVLSDSYEKSTGNYDGSLNDDQLDLSNIEGVKYFDVNIGATWTKKFGKFTPIAGISVNHLTKPKYSLMGSEEPDDKLPYRFVYHASANYQINDKWSIRPNFLLMGQKRAQDFVLGANAWYNLKGRIELIEAVFAGPEFRLPSGNTNADAIIFVAGVKLPKWEIALSRDHTISALQTGLDDTMHGAWEVSVIFIAPDVMLKKKLIPCDRY